MRWIAILLIALILSGNLWADSKGPATNPGRGCQQEQSKSDQFDSRAASNSNCSQQPPVVVEVSPDISASQQAPNKQNGEHNASTPEWISAIATAAVALITGFLAYFTFGLWDANRKLVEDAAKTTAKQIELAGRTAEAMEKFSIAAQENVETAKRIAIRQRKFGKVQLKAYVFLNNINISNIADPGPNIVLTEPQKNPARLCYPTLGPITNIVIRNSGNTPAHDVMHWANMVFREYPYNPEIPFPPPDMSQGSKMLLTPGGISTKWVRNRGPLNDDEIKALRQSKSALYVYGKITYRDEFNEERWTTYCFFHNENTGGIGVTTELTGYHTGNEYK